MKPNNTEAVVVLLKDFIGKENEFKRYKDWDKSMAIWRASLAIFQLIHVE